MADGTWDIAGKTVLLTGGNAGIGKAAAIELVRRGAQVVITARDSAKGEAAEASIREAARLNHMCACTLSCGTPRPSA
ncbi:MAG TPA: SDR family NAD(P)-dependent oxidoreductase [Acidobacteria bacterium]|nr:SDR family NAD(P)-dependent oxidoreductase [Acidobacteriota bacterium]